VEGQAEVRVVFETKNKGKVAGVLVKEGKISRDLSARVIRKNEIINKSRVNSLKRFKNDVKEVATGMECGVGLEGFNGFEVGDIIQFYKQEKVI
jgi:translation initiation factor IF-2